MLEKSKEFQICDRFHVLNFDCTLNQNVKITVLNTLIKFLLRCWLCSGESCVAVSRVFSAFLSNFPKFSDWTRSLMLLLGTHIGRHLYPSFYKFLMLPQQLLFSFGYVCLLMQKDPW